MSRDNKNEEKNKYGQLVGKRLSSVLDELMLSQQSLLTLCIEKGYHITQSMMSKIMSGETTPALQIVQICDILKLNPAEVLSLNEETKINFEKKPSEPSSPPKIITDADDDRFRAYLGDYHAYFYTTQNENLIHDGIFSIKKDNESHRLVVTFEFETGEQDDIGKNIKKIYSGYAYYSSTMNTIYATLESEELGEISYLLFHFDFIAHLKLECRMAIAITAGSGTRRLPVMHRILFSRDEISKTDMEYLCGQLRLNDSEILLSENAFNTLLNMGVLPDSFFENFGEGAKGFVSSVAQVTYYHFNESLISGSFMPPLDKIKTIGLIRKHSSAPRYNKISPKAEENIFKYLKAKKKGEIE